MKYAPLFLWLVVPLGLWLTATFAGTPHVLGTYRYLGGDPYEPYGRRVHIDCTYWGYAGLVTRPAPDRRCPWIRFFTAEAR